VGAPYQTRGVRLKLPRTGSAWAKELGWGIVLLIVANRVAWVIGLLLEGLGADLSGGSEGLWPSTAAVAAFCLITPIIGLGEELLFRVYVQTRLTQVLRGQRILPVFICAVLFALVHGYGAYHAFQVGAFGLVLASRIRRTERSPDWSSPILSITWW